MTITPEWADAIDAYITEHRASGYPPTTQRVRREHLQHLARRTKHSPWEITGEQLLNWFSEQTWATETRRGRRTTFRNFFTWARRTGRRKGNPAKALPKIRQQVATGRPVPRRIYLEALVRADTDEQLWMELAHDHGLRRGEIAVIHSRDLFEDLDGHSLRVHGKGGRERNLPLTPTTARRLLERGEGWLFPGEDHGHISPRWLGKRVSRLLDGDWTIHKLRHAAVTRWE